MKPEIIQQWQYMGKVPPELLKDEVFEKCKKTGITSLQSYLYWAEIEKEPGRFDFSAYDELVEKIKKHNLKWVPFLILGPEYATPQWFQQSEESVYAKCLEHQKESKIQSIWNPHLPKYVERFLKAVSEHYQDKDIFESIGLGISGNWGEAIYPATGGFCGDFHTHLGWWCGDKYACQQYKSFKNKDFPALEKNKQKGLFHFLVGLVSKMPDFFKKWLKLILKINKRKFIFVSEPGYQPKEFKTDEQRADWLDFVHWYLDSMTDWAEFWLKTARFYFPETKIYLVTGGTGHPALGADFSKQSKIAAKYKAGIRITNQTNDYSQSFILTRLVSSASRFYNSYFVTEEAAVLQSPEGVVMRIFDAASSGAKGIYCKNFIGIGGDPCLKQNLPLGKAGKEAEILAKNLGYLSLENPLIKTAVFFPASAIAFDPSIIASIYNQAAKIRDILDFDLVDEQMLKDGALANYQNLLILEGETPEENIPSHINIIRDPEEIKNEIDDEYDGVYATKFENRTMYYNSNNYKIKKGPIEIEPHSIVSINL